MASDPRLSYFDHVVVLMMENRSFDNMVGYLSPKVNGVIGKNLSNPAPVRWDGQPVDGAEKGPVSVSPGGVMDNPNPDPGEYFPHVNTQLYGCVAPHSNAYQSDTKDFDAPFNQPSPLPATAPMNGFVQDYYDNYIATQQNHQQPTRAEYEIIMNCFPPKLVPVTSGLAEGFAICDRWHCAVPSQTFCNRSFFHAATSNGWVTNAPFDKWLANDNETLFNLLEEKCLPWAIYYDEEDVFPLTLLIHFPKLWPYFVTHFHHMDRFYEDVANGTLPAYSFIEPRLFVNHNDQHPPIQILGLTQPSTVTAGEELINAVYNAVRGSGDSTKAGSNSTNTLLTITYDEHGGCYDHVSPPAATPPKAEPGQMNFTFDRLGVRVATTMVSAYTSPFHVVDNPLQHTSMLHTLCEKWGLPSLTARDASAPDFLEAFDRTTPRPGSEWPVLKPLPQPAEAAGQSNHDYPLNELQKAIVGTVNALGKGDPQDLPEDLSVAKAIELMHSKLAELNAM